MRREAKKARRRWINAEQLAALVRKHGCLDLHFTRPNGGRPRIRRIWACGQIVYNPDGCMYDQFGEWPIACHNEGVVSLEEAISNLMEYISILPHTGRYCHEIRVTKTQKRL